MDIGSADLLRQMNEARFLEKALQVAAILGVADVVGDEPVPVATIAERVEAQADPLARVLRLLDSRGVFRLEGGLEGRVSHTPASRLLRSDHPQSFRPFCLSTGTERSFRLAEHLIHMVRTGEPAVGGGTMWSQLEQDPAGARLFDAAMTAKAHSQIAGVLKAHDFSVYRSVVDVAGGAGHLLRAILAANPHVHGILFDRPDVTDAARAADASGRIEFVGGDFFVEIPPGEATVLMDVLHDWTDDECIRILKTVRRSARQGSRILVVETEVGEGAGQEWGKLLDVIMMTLFAGRQRSRAEFQSLFRASGYRLTDAARIEDGSSILIGEIAEEPVRT